jgi:hypothetical protein
MVTSSNDRGDDASQGAGSSSGKSKLRGKKFVVYHEHLSALEELCRIGSLPSVCSAINFVLGQFTQDAIDLLDRRPKRSKTVRFSLGGFGFSLTVTQNNPSEANLLDQMVIEQFQTSQPLSSSIPVETPSVPSVVAPVPVAPTSQPSNPTPPALDPNKKRQVVGGILRR